MKKSLQSALAKYFVISGRAGRPEFWWWHLFYITLLVVLVRLDMRFDALNLRGRGASAPRAAGDDGRAFARAGACRGVGAAPA
jgi:hypothetical protein